MIMGDFSILKPTKLRVPQSHRSIYYHIELFIIPAAHTVLKPSDKNNY